MVAIFTSHLQIGGKERLDAEIAVPEPPLGVKLGILAAVLVVLALVWYQLFFSKVKKDIQAAKQQAQALNESKKKIQEDEERYEELDK